LILVLVERVVEDLRVHGTGDETLIPVHDEPSDTSMVSRKIRTLYYLYLVGIGVGRAGSSSEQPGPDHAHRVPSIHRRTSLGVDMRQGKRIDWSGVRFDLIQPGQREIQRSVGAQGGERPDGDRLVGRAGKEDVELRDDEEGFDEIRMSWGRAEHLSALEWMIQVRKSYQLTYGKEDGPTSTSQTLIVLSHDPVTIRSRLLVPVVTW
jgi:hypothetical protein